MKKIRMISNFNSRSGGLRASIFIAGALCFTYSVSATEFTKLNDEITVFNSQQQTRQIKGKVTDINGLPLGGVTITVPNSSLGVVTDIDGNYTIQIPADTETLLFSYIGFRTAEISINNSSILNVTLEEDLTELEEVVVTGYQTISKERSTGSFAKIDEAQLQTRPAANNVLDRLEGTVAGLSTTADGNLVLRGRGTFNVGIGTRPLLVIDGFAMRGDSDLSSVNPEDIESIQVLKDASAASIWGSAASNGVIVITTKRGKLNQKLNVDFSTFVSQTENIRFDKYEWMTTSQEIDVDLEYIEKGWYNLENFATRNAPISLLHQAEIYRRGFAPNGDIWTNAQYEAYIADLRSRDVVADWEKYLFRSPITQTYNLNLSAGGEKNSLYASVVYNDNQSHSIGTANNRVVMNFQDIFKFNDRISLTAGLNVGISKSLNNGVSDTSLPGEEPYAELVDENGQTIQYYESWNPWVSRERESIDGMFSYTRNFLDDVRANDNTSRNVDVRAQVALSAEILKDLTLNSSIQLERGFSRNDQLYSMDHSATRILVNDLFIDGVYNIPVGTDYRYSRGEYQSWVVRNTLTWDKNWTNHKLTFFGGLDINKSFSEYFQDRKFGYSPETTQHTPVNNADLIGGRLNLWTGDRYFPGILYGNENSDDREYSVFSNLGYEFLGKYAINGSFRIDQKNLFGSDPEFRYKPLWSVGAAWNIHKEGFMENVSWVDRLKLRSTYGITGNASNQFSPYARAVPRTGSWGAFLYRYLSLSRPENKQLRWEETTTFNVGLDFGLFNNRVNGAIEYYNRYGRDLIGNVPVDPTVGWTLAEINYASMVNSGIELTLNTDIFESQDFGWNLGFNFAYNKNEVKEISDQIQTPGAIISSGKLEVGSPYLSLYSYNYAGLDQYGNPTLYDLEGNIKSWREGVTDPEELIYHGVREAPYFGGLNTTIRYKAFDLVLNATYQFGNKFYHNYGYVKNGETGRLPKQWLNRWQQPGDENTTRMPKISYNGVNPDSGQTESLWDTVDGGVFYTYSQDNVLDGGFLRIRDIVLGYTMPDRYLDNLFFDQLRLTFQVTNPFLFTVNKRGIDPQAFAYSSTSGAASIGTYRPATANLKQFTLGLRVSF